MHIDFIDDFQFPKITSCRAHAHKDTTDFGNVALHFCNAFVRMRDENLARDQRASMK
jgi:hypothetical protein